MRLLTREMDRLQADPRGARRLIIAMVLVGTVSGPLHAFCMEENAAVEEASHDAEVQTFWSTLDATWLARDAERFGQLFTEQASFGFVGRGSSLEGRAAILQHFRKQFARQAADLHHVSEVREIRVIAPGIVAVDGKVEVLRAGLGESAEPLRRFAIFAVMLRSADEWQIHLLRAYRLPTVTAAAGEP